MKANNNIESLCKSEALLKLGRVTVVVSYCFRKAMLSYCKYENKTERTNVLMDFIRRIEANTTGIREMARASIETYHSSSYLKLPMGLLIRNCLMDSMQGLYFSELEDDSFNTALHSFNQDYVKSLPSRFEVYQDRVGLFKDDELLQQIFGSQIEDVFPEYIDWTCLDTKSQTFKIANKKGQYTIASMYRKLKETEDYSVLASKLNAYYKKYSQYEHYSQMGHGDSLTSFDDDAPLMAKAFEYITASTERIVGNTGCPTEIIGIMSRAKDEIEKLLNH